MSVNIQGTKNILCLVVLRQQTLTACRHTHSAATSRPPLFNSIRATLTTNPNHNTASDLHARKRRRYSQDASAPSFARPERKPKPRFKQDEWEAVEGSSLLVKSRKSGFRNKQAPTSVRAAPDRDAHIPLSQERQPPYERRIRRNTKPVEDKGTLVAKENRALFLPRKAEEWQIQKKGLLQKFKEEGWQPRKKLSPDTIEGIRGLHEQDPEKYSTPNLAEHFKVSPEAIRRILKSNFRPTEAQMQERRVRWAKRHDRIWDQKVQLGLRPPRKMDWRVEEPEEFEENLKAKELLDAARRA
ncbi:hypothetical protein LTR84_008765 [Exophiala bonariae]|uniref:Required for respiratory growth protein 9, mitochondrial n=1 Tax=Exophiala bonariae TaxID=1690606 RepID=A0AAV9MYI0_9EURO|nr:hypothetical protein LTR84_008765 [Exophiala bonariae]